MLQLWDEPKAIDGHEKVFLARYHQALKWARHFSTNRPWQAGDLVQDAFLQFIALRPDLDQIRDLDAFLYAIVRNVHRSMLYRHLRFPHLSLSALDFDSASDGVRLADKEVLLSVIDDLFAVCDFTCERKEVSKTGSLLILRFFHGYNVLETAALMRVTRGAVNERLRHARREAREYLLQRRAEAVGKVVPLSSSGPKRTPVRESADLGQNEIIDSLRSRIFGSAQGDCLSESDFETIYGPSVQKPVDHLTLAHIVSCHGCLNQAAAYLGLPSLEDQKPPADSPGSGSATGDSSEQHNDQHNDQPSGRWRGKFEKLLDQTPEEIHIAVNGLPLASQPVAGGRSDLSVSVPIQERIDFVEIFSEHDVRLLMLPVLAVPPEGECEQAGHLDFSDGSTLSVRLVFDDPWPTLHVRYGEPEPEPEHLESRVLERSTGVPRAVSSDQPSAWFSPLGILFRPSAWIGPRFWSGLVAMGMIVVLLFVQSRETTLSAAVLVSRAEEWERTAAAGLVLHRTFDLVERPKGSLGLQRRRVEVWRKANSRMKLTQLIDESGRLIKTAKEEGTPPLLTEETAWRFEPAPDTYRALAGNLESSRVKYKSQTIELRAPALRLTLDRSDYSPIAEVLHTGKLEFEFRAIASESVPERQSPFAVADAPSAPVRHAWETPRNTPLEGPPAATPADVDLDQTELAARLALHELKADLGEDVRIRRNASGIEVAGIVDSEQRKEVLTNRLGNVRNLRVSLLSPEDVASRNDIAAMLSTPPAAGNEQPPVLAEWLRDQFPDLEARHAFVFELLETSRNCLRRVYALRRLSERYADAPPPEVKQMAGNHIRELSVQWAALEELVAPLFPPAQSPLEPGTSEPVSRRNDILLLFTNMKKFDQDVGVLFTEHAARESDPPSGGSQPDMQQVLLLKNSIAKGVAELSRN
jgi:RNA polymerase sigma factor (sigma-70 family)